MANMSLLTPPIAFAIIFAAVVLFALAMKRLAFKRNNGRGGQAKPYACGEETPDQAVQPSYAQFYPFAFFFTILHVVALTVTTMPLETWATFVIAVIYIAGAVVGLTVLYRK